MVVSRSALTPLRTKDGFMKQNPIELVKYVATVIFIAGLCIPGYANACARDRSQFSAMLSSLKVDRDWSGFIEGHWAKKANGTGWNMVYYKNRLAFAVQNPITGAKDAQFIEICPSSKGSDFTVRGEVLGRKQNLEIKVSGQDLRVMNGMAKGVFKKRSKTRQQILQEFSNEFSKL